MLLIPDVPIARVFRPAYGIFSFPSSSFVSPLVAAACLFPPIILRSEMRRPSTPD